MSGITLFLTCTDHNGYVLQRTRITRSTRSDVDADESVVMAEMMRRYPKEYVFHDRIPHDIHNEQTAPRDQCSVSLPALAAIHQEIKNPPSQIPHTTPPIPQERHKDRYEKGDRVQISREGLASHVGTHTPHRRGIVVGYKRRDNNPLVLWDGVSEPTSIFHRFIRLAD